MLPLIDTQRQSEQIGAWLAGCQDALRDTMLRALRGAMFSNRPEVRPALLGRIAGEETTSLCAFVAHADPAAAVGRGMRLCQTGLGDESVLGMGQAVRQFFLNDAPPELRSSMLELVESYHSNVVQGYMRAHTAKTLEEQERIRSALQRTLSRYAVQMAVAAEVARAATSILDLDELLQTASELIRERFGLYYVAVFLTDELNRWAYLQASSGEAGQVMLRRGHRLKVGGDSLVGWCVAHAEARIALDVGEKAISFDTPLLTDIHSEMVIPLISRGKVIGAMAVQSRQVNAFSDQDVAVISITADQLANAIENARLFRERERQINLLALINDMGRALSAALDFDSLLETVHQQVGRIYEASHFSIASYDSASDSWRTVFDYRDGVRMPSSARTRRADIVSYIARSRQPVLLSNRREIAGFCERKRFQPPDPRVRSAMGVPLIASDRIVGVMTISSTAQEDQYSEQDLVIFTTIAAQTAVAIENARLYEQLRHELLDRMRASEELREAKDAAEAASRAKSTFLANMSHELRTPLTGIIGYSELLQREASHFGYSDFVPDLRKIHTAGNHLLAIINDILDLSRIESGKMPMFLETFGVSALLDEVQTTAAPLIEKNRNTLEARIAPNLGVMHADLTKVRQVILNLVSNAAKFTDAGRVTLTADRVDRGGADWIRISVSDTGIGISEEQLGKLFQDFTQADTSMTRKYGGTGLGLALSRRLTEMLGGKIEVVSALGAGSTFTVLFPATVAEPQPASPPAPPVTLEPPPAELSDDPILPTVLVIDDDPDAREVLVRCLSECAVEVVTAADGEHGLELARSLKPAVITLDVLLPGMNGWEVLADIKGDPDLADTHVVMLTVVDERDRAFILGASDYLIKPINQRRLIDVIHSLNPAQPPPGKQDAVTILVVEDDEALRSLLERTLTAEGFGVVLAADGHEALARVAERRPAAILLDLILPELDGIELIGRLRAAPEQDGIPIIVLTSGDLSAEERARLSSTVEQIMHKGAFSRDDLVRQVREVVMRYPLPALAQR